MVVYTQEGAEQGENQAQSNGADVSSFGYLKINVSAAQRALPVYNAQIMVYGDTVERKQELLAVLRTDSSGETEMISLPAPGLAESQQPLPPEAPLPFNVYYVRIVAANYVTRENVPVQIFPGIRSDLVVNMQASIYVS